MVSPACSERVNAALVHNCDAVPAFQNRAFCASFDVGLATARIVWRCVSLNSTAYRSLPSEGGASGRNCDVELSTHGRIAGNCIPAPLVRGVVNERHSPMASPPEYAAGTALN